MRNGSVKPQNQSLWPLKASETKKFDFNLIWQRAGGHENRCCTFPPFSSWFEQKGNGYKQV